MLSPDQVTTGALLFAALVLLWIVIVSVRSLSEAVVPLAAVLIAPIFLKFTGSSIGLGDPIAPDRSSPGQTFPLGVLAVGLVLVVAAAKTTVGGVRWRRSALIPPVLILVGLNLLVFLAGLFEEIRPENFLFFAQTIAPILCFFVSLNFVRNVETVQKILWACVAVMGVAVTLLSATSVVARGVSDTLARGVFPYIGIFPVYATFDYFPLVVSVAYGLGLCLMVGNVPARGRLLLAGWVWIMLVSIFFLHSKGGFLTMAVLTMVQALLFGSSAAHRRRAVAFALLASAVVIFFLVGPKSLTVQSFHQLGTEGSADPSFRSRVADLVSAAQDIADNPVAGLMYVARSEDLRGIRHIANPHNQYLTYGIRGGIMSLLVFVWIVVVFLRRLWRTLRCPSSDLVRTLAVGLFSVFLGVCLVSNVFQDNFTQPYSGFLLWLLMGVGESLYLANRAALREGARVLPLEDRTLGG